MNGRCARDCVLLNRRYVPRDTYCTSSSESGWNGSESGGVPDASTSLDRASVSQVSLSTASQSRRHSRQYNTPVHLHQLPSHSTGQLCGLSSSSALFLVFYSLIFCLVPCGRLSCLIVNFKCTLKFSNHIILWYRITVDSMTLLLLLLGI